MMQRPTSKLLVYASALWAGAFALPCPTVAQTDSGPTLLSTTGGGVSWTDVDEMIAAARAGNPAARLHYAIMLEEGYDTKVPRDPDQALKILRELAATDNHEALLRLGKITHDGLLGVAKDYKRALDLYRRAAAFGNNTAMHNVGAMYVSGRGVKRDYIEGLAWLMLGAENGIGEDAVEKVRQRLRKYPDRIAAAEKRLPALKAELAQLAGTELKIETPAPATPEQAHIQLLSPAAPSMKVEAPRPVVTPDASPFPSLAPTRPTFGVPSISIPPPPAPAVTPVPATEKPK